MAAPGPDPHSCSNFHEVCTRHLHLSLECDFKRQIFHGYVEIQAEVLADGVTSMTLDSKYLSIESVTDVSDGKDEEKVCFTLPVNSAVFGHVLHIPIHQRHQHKGALVKYRINYSTSPDAPGVQWLSPLQTAGKQHGFVYTQGQAILARTYLPCQDTPSVKAPYSATISVQAPLVAACAGLCVGEPEEVSGGFRRFNYRQPVPIPAYLITIVAGRLEKAAIGPRSSVWCEPPLLEAAVYEFSEHTEKFIQAGEKITGVPYDWHTYDVVVLPSAFPYGGMENPNLTFLSASLLSGDRSLTNVVAHEITHSWAGNLVTNATWTDFWLNEGFTVYIERLILGEVHQSQAYRHFEILIGYNELQKTLLELESDEEWRKLQPDMSGIDPDDAFSKIPYEKGSLFLLYLETLVGGPQAMQEWLRQYFTDYRGLSLHADQCRQHFLNFFSSRVSADTLQQIDWQHWLKDAGLPHFSPLAVVDMSLTTSCQQLADQWLQHQGANATPDDLKSMEPKQVMYFLDLLIAACRQNHFDHALLERIESVYGLSSVRNVEINFRWLVLCLHNDYRAVIPHVVKFLGQHGRGLYVKPLFIELNRLDHDTAVSTYAANKDWYHAVIRSFCVNLLKD
eukprot:TRINITY_DN294_c0_g1_i3.p1 TRINITY_DN294_c0_g1~~TRINITY_DN294_c0_g1_i3.p1  ORF type:complete len:644 (+),score=207.19 TRINITY_DN294_c0_g1_i3:72-1934(+)